MNFKEIAIWAMIAFVFALGIYLVYWIHTESFMCLSNPYGYSVKLLEKANQAEVDCTCSAYKPSGLVRVMLTRDGLRPLPDIFVQNYTYNNSFLDWLNKTKD